MTLNELFKNTTYDDTLFSVETKSTIESRIFMKSVRGSEVPYITCAIRDKEIKLTPEEAVRQLYIYKLMNDYGYAASRIQLETPIHFGREVKRADIAIMDKDRPMVPYIIVELKKPKLTDGKEQLKSYCNATGAPIGVWTNGEQISCYNRKDPNFFEEISDIPKATQKLSDIINEKFTYEDLKRKDKISTQKKSLRSLIKEMEDEVLASAGVDSFEEIFKLIFTKLYDELICANDPTAYLQFRNTGDTDYELKEKIQGLFDDAKKKWEGIFTDESKILLSPSHLAVCVASLQDILIGAPKPLMLEEEDFSILGIREYTWQWPSQMYPSDTLLLAQGLTREEYYSRFLPAIWKVDGVDDKLLIRAIREARSARFEFGETPKGR